jgi:DNA replication protein DnaC
VFKCFPFYRSSPPEYEFSQWNEVFADVTIASAILDRVLHHCTVVNIKGESYRLKERKEFMKQKQHIVNALFEPS